MNRMIDRYRQEMEREDMIFLFTQNPLFFIPMGYPRVEKCIDNIKVDVSIHICEIIFS
jgi:hypothetical protein